MLICKYLPTVHSIKRTFERECYNVSGIRKYGFGIINVASMEIGWKVAEFFLIPDVNYLVALYSSCTVWLTQMIN